MENKKIIKFGSTFFIALLVAYLFILGAIVELVAEKKELSNILDQEFQLFYALETQKAQMSKNLDLNSFLSLGYAESRKFEVIKTVKNVASLKASNY